MGHSRESKLECNSDRGAMKEAKCGDDDDGDGVCVCVCVGE